MNQLLTEQIKNHFGESYPQVLDSTRRYVATVYQHALQWGVDKNHLLDDMGGRSGMLNSALLHIIEYGDQQRGLEAFHKMIAREYVNARRQISLEDLISDHYTFDEWDAHSRPSSPVSENRFPAHLLVVDSVDSAVFGDDTPRDVGVGESPVPVDKFLFTNDERDFAFTVARTGTVKEAARLLGLEYQGARSLWNRIRSRARYHLKKA